MSCFSLFFFNDTATTEIYTLSLHDALPILRSRATCSRARRWARWWVSARSPEASAAGRFNVSRAGSSRPTATTIRPSSSSAGWPISRPGPSFTSSPRGSSPRSLDEPLRGTEHARPIRPATSLPHRHRRGCSGGSSDPLVPPLQVVERGTGGEARAIEAGRGELLAPQLLARQSHRHGEGTRHAVYQPQVRAPALRAVARAAGHRAARNRGRGPAHRGRWCDHVRGGYRRGRGEVLRIRQGGWHAADRRARGRADPAPYRAVRQAVRHQGRDPQPRPGGHAVPFPV